MALLSIPQAAKQRGVTSRAAYDAVERGRLRTTSGNKIDDSDPVNAKWLSLRPPKGNERRKATMNPDIPEGTYRYSPEAAEGYALEAEKLRADINYKNKQSRKLDLQFEVEKKNLVMIEQVALWMGHFAAGIRANLLPLGKRIARNDKKLEDRITKEISKGLAKTRDMAAAHLRRESEKLIEALGVRNVEN